MKSATSSPSGNYKTSELGVASLLFYQQVPLVDVDTDDPRRFVLVFEISEEDGLAMQRQWWNGTVKVEPRGFFNAISQVKDVIHAKRRELEYN